MNLLVLYYYENITKQSQKYNSFQPSKTKLAPTYMSRCVSACYQRIVNYKPCERGQWGWSR